MQTTSDTGPVLTSTISALSDRELLRQTRDMARLERHLQATIIDHLTEIDARSLYLHRGYSSLFDYAVRELGYSDGAAGRRIAAMRLCAEHAGTRERLRDGSLSLSAAAELQWAFDRQRRRSIGGLAGARAQTAESLAGAPSAAAPGASPESPRTTELPAPPVVLDAAGRQKLVDEAAGKSARQVRQMLADVAPEMALPADRIRPLGDGRYELKALIDADCQQGLEQLRGLLSHVDPRMTVGQLVGRLVQEALDRHDPSRPLRRRGSGHGPAETDGEAGRTSTAKQQAAPQRGSASTAKGAARHAAATDSLPKAETADGRQAASTAKETVPQAPQLASSKQTRSTPTAKPRATGRAIPAATRRQVWRRDEGRCRYVDPQTGRRCNSRHLIEIDHIRPYALGGGADPANLRLLCRAHHGHRHRPREPARLSSPTPSPDDPVSL